MRALQPLRERGEAEVRWDSTLTSGCSSYPSHRGQDLLVQDLSLDESGGLHQKEKPMWLPRRGAVNNITGSFSWNCLQKTSFSPPPLLLSPQVMNWQQWGISCTMLLTEASLWSANTQRSLRLTFISPALLGEEFRSKDVKRRWRERRNGADEENSDKNEKNK